MKNTNISTILAYKILHYPIYHHKISTLNKFFENKNQLPPNLNINKYSMECLLFGIDLLSIITFCNLYWTLKNEKWTYENNARVHL